jgi:magnesium-transporting ATPase (P-type)
MFALLKDNIPADCLLLHSSEDQGVVYVETSSLDGETNLKRKQALSESQEALPTLGALCNWKGAVRAEFPHRFISSFTGNVHVDPSSMPARFLFVLVFLI